MGVRAHDRKHSRRNQCNHKFHLNSWTLRKETKRGRGKRARARIGQTRKTTTRRK
uniref:Uncharacterized protein n=1 Tax=Physcomitrium patens TaxID=3218 RepID=A0A2K1KNT8_PHYPA|nr:hypothetical protein PHYPA_006323 [Physcomitrium patens]